jgi:hypothetical protein
LKSHAGTTVKAPAPAVEGGTRACVCAFATAESVSGLAHLWVTMNAAVLALSDADAALSQPALLGSHFCFGTLLTPICAAVFDSLFKSSN